MPINKILNNICIDDAVNILKFYYDSQDHPSRRIEEIKDKQLKKDKKEDSFEFYFANKKYFFYSKKVIPILSILTRRNKHTKLEDIKEKVVHTIEKKFHTVIVDKEEVIKKLKEMIEDSIRLGYPFT